MTENDISFKIRGCAFKVHNKLGPGLLESVYEAALTHELRQEGLVIRTQVGVPLVYDELKFEVGFRLDLLVEEKVVVEIKSVDALADVHYKQLLTYLKLTDRKLGLLINFNVARLEDKISLVRIGNFY
jgi:GxxExxY protein